MSPHRYLCVLAVLSALVAGPASAQETINYASISGRVTDPQGAVVVGATVVGAADGDRRGGIDHHR